MIMLNNVLRVVTIATTALRITEYQLPKVIPQARLNETNEKNIRMIASICLA